jgi:hypothetical protein
MRNNWSASGHDHTHSLDSFSLLYLVIQPGSDKLKSASGYHHQFELLLYFLLRGICISSFICSPDISAICFVRTHVHDR